MSTHYNQGAYRCEILDQGLSQSKTGNPQIWLKILPKESLDPADAGLQLDGYERTVFWTITDNTIDFIIEKLKTLGFTGQSFRQLDLNSQNPESFVGQVEDFYCKHETYNGEDREKWDLSRGDFEMKPLDDSEARKLDALWGKKLGGSKKTVNPAKPQGVPTEQTTRAMANAADPDIPF